ncbi:MAG TPA: hypothetical protein VFM88_06960 [Vicinamibacteria bacterium]|nr:hypothetical protein [Vicinamibacteria bacterium]
MRRLAVIALLVPVSAWADRVVLKGGGSVSGVVLEKDDRRVLLEVGPGRIGIAMARVERIESGASPLAGYRERAARIAPGDAAAWVALGRWARDQGLATQAREAFEAALQADAGLAEAHLALDHVRHGDVWLTQDESYHARGFVPFEGGWVTPAEREATLRERGELEARAQARRESEARAREAEARARAAEAEARRIEGERAEESGLPYWWVVAGGGCTWPGCGVRPAHPPNRRPPVESRPPRPDPHPQPTTGTMR